MAKYMIHSCNQRKWYVDKYLVPSMLEQNIDEEDILIYLDSSNDGCLQSFINSIQNLSEEGDTWHLQDDVLVCSDFKVKTEQLYEAELVCGFASKYDAEAAIPGVQFGIDNIWFSFPCIRISNSILKHFAIWFSSYVQNDNRFKSWITMRKHDDLLFRYFVQNYYKDIKGLNVAPNLVEHVDWLIGESIVNRGRDSCIRSLYWNEEYLVNSLKKKLSKSVDER